MGNKIYIKKKKPRALCGHHDHFDAYNDRGTYSIYSMGRFRNNTAYVSSMVRLMLCGAIQLPTGSGSTLAMNWVALKKRGKMRLSFKDVGNLSGETSPTFHREAMKNLPPMTYHKTGQTGADCVMAVCTNFPNHQAQGRKT